MQMKSKCAKSRWMALAGIGIAVQAAFGVEFKKVGGDISSEADWGSSYSSFSSSSYIDFINSGTYYASDDVGCRLFRVKNANDVVIDASANNPTITINQQTGDQSFILLPKDNSSITFKGGLWNAGGGTTAYLRCCSAVNTGEAATNRSVAIVGGAVVTNVANVYCAGGNNSASSAHLAYNSFNNLVVSGAGTRLYADNIFCSYSYEDGSVQTNNAVTISDGAVVTVASACYTDSKLAAVGQGKLSGNIICVSNATLKLLSNGARPLLVGSTPGSSGNRFVLSGSSALLDVNPVAEFDFFVGSDIATTGNEVLIENGATFLKSDTSFALFKYSHGNTLRVSGGARFGLADTSVANFITIGRWEACSSNNTVIVEDGGSLEANYIRVTCRENALVVSNATVTCAGDGAPNENNACTIGYYHATSSPANGVTGNKLVMRGSTPALRAPNGRVMFRYFSHCDFEVPTEGYAAGHVPIVAKSFEIKTGCSLSAKLDGYRDHGKSATYTLVETTDGVTLGDGVLDAANAELGELGRFSLSNEGKNLLLHAKGQSGITVIFQ